MEQMDSVKRWQYGSVVAFIAAAFAGALYRAFQIDVAWIGALIQGAIMVAGISIIAFHAAWGIQIYRDWRPRLRSKYSEDLNRRTALGKLQNIMIVTEHPAAFLVASTPGHLRAFLYATPFVVLGIVLSQSVIATAVSAVVFVLVRKITSSETWTERFCKLLTDYQPIDETSFESLLTKFNTNTAKRRDLAEWLRVETYLMNQTRSEHDAVQLLIAKRLQR